MKIAITFIRPTGPINWIGTKEISTEFAKINSKSISQENEVLSFGSSNQCEH